MEFTPKQQEVITTRNKNILVSAAAGSGKTSVLVERILSMITDAESPVDIDRFLIVTFTSAAASEMRERIHRTILSRLEACPSDANLQKQSTLIHNAQITTIDSFCLFLLRNHFHEIGLDPAFRVGDPGEIKLMEKEVLQQTLEAFYCEGESEFLYFSQAYCPDGKDGKIEKLVEDLYQFSMSHPWPEEWLTECEEKIGSLDETQILRSEWMIFGLQLAMEKILRAREMAQEALALCNRPDGPYMYADQVTSDIEILDACIEKMSGEIDADAYERMSASVKNPGWARLSAKKDETVSEERRNLVKNLRESYKKLIKNAADTMFAETSLAMTAEKEKEAGRLERVLLRITKTYIKNLTAFKKEKNVLDFSDIEHYALNILFSDGKPTKTAEMYRGHYKAVMIDEYQDSNMVQELILASIATQEKGNCNRFMVGDMKQSIYRFRMARPEIFMEKYQAYKENTEDDCLICLKQNFRSRKEVLDSTNAVFSQLMRPQIGGVVYDDDAALYLGADYPEAEGCETELCLAVTGEKGEEKRSAEAYMIANKIKWLKQNFRINGREPEYRDMVILLRSGSGVDEQMKEILMSEGIPAHVTSKTGYFSASEVSRLMDLLSVMNNPYDDIAFCSVSTSLFFGMTNEELALITATTERGLSLYERFVAVADADVSGINEAGKGLPIETVEKVKESLSVLRELREEAVVCSMTELVNKIIARFHYTEYVTALPAGEQRKANVEMFVQKTVDFEKTSYHGLFHFLRYMEQLKKYEVDFGEAATLTETADVVRIMTIHKSKGLEFPICFVAGLDKKYNMRDTSAQILLDADWGVVSNRVRPQAHTTGKTMRKMLFAGKMKRDSLGEELRVLYVAMTRAKEKLILTAAVDTEMDVDAVCAQTQAMCGDAQYEIPLDMIENAKSALEHLLLAYSRNRKCFSVQLMEENQIQRKQVQYLSEKMLREERIQMLSGAEEDAKPSGAQEEALRERFAYIYPHEALASLYTKTSVSELKHAAMKEDGVRVLFETEEKEQEYLPAFMRQTETVHEGAARGSAMHRILELIDFADYEDLQESVPETGTVKEKIREKLDEDIAGFVKEGRMQEAYARLIMRDKVVAFLQSDMVKRMAAAQKKKMLFKEQPFVLSVSASLLDEKFPKDEKVLIQGIIDVFFEEDGEITVLDYKTDRVSALGELKERYRSQLDYYEEAIRQLTGKKVKEKVLYSFALLDQISWN